MILGRIITKSKNIKTIDFIRKVEEYTEDTSIPTLIIGKERAKTILSDKFSVFNRKVSDNLEWTFLKTEKRNEYEIDFNNFNKKIIDKFKKNVDFYEFNLFSNSLYSIKKLINYFSNSIPKYVFITQNHIYSFSEQGKNNVIGISLYELEYIGVSKSKIIDRLSKIPSCHIIFDDNFLSYETKRLLSTDDFYVPYLYFLKKC